MGADDLAYNPMVDYWLRMTAFAFTAIGLQFLAVAIWWRRQSTWAWCAAVFQVVSGVVLLISAYRIGLSSGNYHADVLFCFSTGFLMGGSLATSWWIERASPAPANADPQS